MDRLSTPIQDIEQEAEKDERLNAAISRLSTNTSVQVDQGEYDSTSTRKVA